MTLAIKFGWRSFLDWCLQNDCELTKEDLLEAINSGASLEIIRLIGQRIGATVSSTIRVREVPRNIESNVKPSEICLRQRNLLQVCLSTAIAKSHKPAISWLLSRKTKVDAESVSQAVTTGQIPALKKVLLKKKAHVKHVLLAAKCGRWPVFEYLTLRVSIGQQTLTQLAEMAIDQYSVYLLRFLEMKDYNFEYRLSLNSQTLPSSDELREFLNRGFIIPYPLLNFWQVKAPKLVHIAAEHLSQIDFSVLSVIHSATVIQILVKVGFAVPFHLMGHAIATDNAELMMFLISNGYSLSSEELENLLAYNAARCIRTLHLSGKVFPTYLLQKVCSNQGSNDALFYLFRSGYRLSPELVQV